jgi:hypothetical protein
MSKQVLQNNTSAGLVRSQINDNFTELYSNVDQLSAQVESLLPDGGITGDYLPLSGGAMTGPISFGSLYGPKLDQGIYDSFRGGLSGISLVCSVNYDFNWQAGWITALEQDRLTPRPLYVDSEAGTTLKVWSGFPGTGTEITHTGITFADNTTQTTAFTGGFLPLTGGTITGDLALLSSLEVGSNVDTVFFVGDGKVGVNTETPNAELTIVGNVSASGTIEANGDVTVTDSAKGLVLVSPDNTLWRVTVSNAGVLSVNLA